MRPLPLVLVATLATACISQRIVGQPSQDVRDETIRVGPRNQVDILFMIDNSPSMAPKQAALRASFPELVTRVQTLATAGLPASFHIGVVDSDLGAGPYNLNSGQCHPDGDGGQLNTVARTSTLGPPPADCASFQLAGGAHYIDYNNITGSYNFGPGLDLPTAFSCIASVGDGGCGFESQLESVYRVLTQPELNPGFLRNDALLVVVFVTDEDDCSAPPDSDLFDPSSAGVAKYGTLHSFRCTQFALSCEGKPLDPSTPMTDRCVPVAGGPLYDLNRYIDLFTKPRDLGGIKDAPGDVVVLSLAAPPLPVAAELTQPCADQVNTPSCAMLQHSCVSPISPGFFGDPAVRLHAVVQATASPVESSICLTDYTTALDGLADAMGSSMRGGCLPGAVVDLLDIQCNVTLDGTVVTRCGDGHLPCWAIDQDGLCAPHLTLAGDPQQLRLEVQGAPPSSAIVATCPLYVPTS
jgi:hypothetical protein